MSAVIARIPRNPLKGSASVKVVGFAGPGCKELTSALEKAIGITVSDTETEEIHQQPETEAEVAYEGDS